MGRKHKLTPQQQDEIRKKAEGQSVRELGRSYMVRAVRHHRQKIFTSRDNVSPIANSIMCVRCGMQQA